MKERYRGEQGQRVGVVRTYGRLNQVRKFTLILNSSLKINKYSQEQFRKRGLRCYKPKLKKRFWFCLVGSLVLLSPLIPFGFVGAFPLMSWGLR